MDADTRGYPHEPTPSGDEATGDMLVVSLRAVKVPKPRILAELLREYPELEPEDIRQVLAYAAASLDDKVVELPKSA